VHFQVSFQQFDMHEFALLRVFTVSACELQSYIAVVRFDESVEDVKHERDSLLHFTLEKYG
jgi:hypothetical protein